MIAVVLGKKVCAVESSFGTVALITVLFFICQTALTLLETLRIVWDYNYRHPMTYMSPIRSYRSPSILTSNSMRMSNL